MVARRVRAGFLLHRLCHIWTARREPDLSTDAQPHCFANMDSASNIDARPIVDRNGYGYGNDHSRGDSNSVGDCDPDTESDSHSNGHRFIDVISHCNEYIPTHGYRYENIDGDDNTFLNTHSHADPASLFHT